jgi:alkanesulfonate monooxygenase SsuD/methylene tetrahydromethanopterin reductase-like flavin-dependent oxidoreductase (luciferase family)
MASSTRQSSSAPSSCKRAAWRHPGAQADAGNNFRHYVQLAQKAEAAKFDAVFLADSVGVRSSNLPSLSRTSRSDHSSR